MIFFQSLIVLGCQYLNLYKTAWWMPYSTATYAINFSLVDFNLTMFIIVVMSRRFVYSIYKLVVKEKTFASRFFYYLAILSKFMMVCNVLVAFCYFSIKIFTSTGLVTAMFLFYPLITYIFLFKFNLRALFGRLPLKQNKLHSKLKTRPDYPVHVCSCSAEEVRGEVDCLRGDFNSRLSQIFFNSMCCCYYSACVPLCFSQSSLYYNPWWTCQFMVLVWLGFMCLFANHFLHINYLDCLHRCCCHLGHWSKIDSSHLTPHTVHTAWSELQLFVQDSTVKHVKGLFRARGHTNAAEPGNNPHCRFHMAFSEPKRMPNIILWSTSFLVGNEFLSLLWASNWDVLLTIVLLIFPNYYVLFKQNRNKLILDKIYK